MQPEQIRDLELLKEPFKTKVKAFLQEMQEIDPMAAHETFRTAERQLWLRNNNKSWVTVSNHQLGLAADLHFTTGEAFPPSDSDRWKTARLVAKRFGIDNGQDLWGTDANHFQDNGEPIQEIDTNVQISKDLLEAIMQLNSDGFVFSESVINGLENLKVRQNAINNALREVKGEPVVFASKPIQ